MSKDTIRKLRTMFFSTFAAPSPRRDVAPEDLGLEPIEEHEEAGARRHLLDHVNGTPEQEPGRPRLAQQPALAYLDLRESLAAAQVCLGLGLGLGLGSGLELGSGSWLGRGRGLGLKEEASHMRGAPG